MAYAVEPVGVDIINPEKQQSFRVAVISIEYRWIHHFFVFFFSQEQFLDDDTCQRSLVHRYSYYCSLFSIVYDEQTLSKF
jgi:hypothetical protein